MKSNDQPETITRTEVLPSLTTATIKRVQEGVAAAGDRSVREIIAKTLAGLEARHEGQMEPRVDAGIRRFVLRSLIHAIFRVRVENLEKIPQTSAIIAANHLHHLDPLLLLAEIPTQPHYYIVGDARTLYNKWWKRFILGFAGGVIPLARIWKEEIAVIQAAKAGRQDLTELAQTIEETVPTGGDIPTLRQIDRIVLGILAQGDGMILFPEGRLGNVEGKLHLPLKRGTVIYALRAGVPIVPIALIGTHDLCWGKELTVRVGEPLYFDQTNRPNRQEVDVALHKLQEAMQDLLPTDYQEPTGSKLLRHFLNHMLW
ncbi:Phospholipid/glycerol acyltransferase [Trichormus variabilis ATCC 29413]|uniref:Phospholipid/glycerol acyltransferase n=2 Tax=Anabaena variabilis TaxID=264691 RepID=Q3M4N4_TRIV2|nr:MULTISPECIES: 1-acyl-sn-glycerol-3-phosphate acyltransferase [Nostocaceae]ABA24052.1 Phospholipid/glycerol acyltransferase [Trichormus variabilis ATCC 29413]MBC1213200.1 1-acyl-sn-glycerol-3-phosphate acyltransferase [Trichormus variabilis ARAD]MBC1253945.1 1-acyl-sn-glycerol-3-phosphate acyltransferase [Trichormus variabilis V5]MBC1266656.1 1-acyl-sn-glycerol-3-phosphate acyltransferase [Trichormus variabilis FSR]MBC1300729.1 1-acyl-sn-glycerol-3-phosphate acyltransferase [Trichormus varia